MHTNSFKYISVCDTVFSCRLWAHFESEYLLFWIEFFYNSYHNELLLLLLLFIQRLKSAWIFFILQGLQWPENQVIVSNMHEVEF